MNSNENANNRPLSTKKLTHKLAQQQADVNLSDELDELEPCTVAETFTKQPANQIITKVANTAVTFNLLPNFEQDSTLLTENIRLHEEFKSKYQNIAIKLLRIKEEIANDEHKMAEKLINEVRDFSYFHEFRTEVANGLHRVNKSIDVLSKITYYPNEIKNNVNKDLYGERGLLKCLQGQCEVVQNFVGDRRANKIINDNIVDDPEELEDAVYALQTTDPKIKQQANTIEKVKKETKLTAKSNGGEKREPVSGTSSLTNNKERKERERSREGSIGSISRLGYGLTESREGKGSSTQRTYFDTQTGASYTSRHDNIKEVTKRLGHSRSSSRLSHEDQIKKREASLNKKFGGMSFGK